jgi:LysM repeat protein
MYLQNWFDKNPEDWSREVAEIANGLRQFNVEVTWANEQNLDLEGHPHGASPAQPIPPVSLYQDINRWNLEMIRRLRQLLPWARLHYPAFANDHSDDKNQGGYLGLDVCRPSIELADVMDCHCYWRPDDGPLTLDGGQRFVLTHHQFPNKPIFISECGDFAVQDPRSPEQYITFIQSLYNYPYVEGATFFIWDSDAAPENALNVIQRSGALVRALLEASKEPPAVLPPVPAAPPSERPQPVPQPVPADGIEYIVQPGDTLIGIAKRFGVDLVLLMNVNQISDARTLRAGQRLRIPGAETIPSPPGDITEPPVIAPPPEIPVPAPDLPPPLPPPVPAPPPDLPPAPEPPPLSDGPVYIVQKGDTLSAIARRFNVTVDAIVVANGLTNPNLIHPGQRLVIPQPSMVLQVAEAKARAEMATSSAGVLGIGDPTTPIVSEREISEYLQGRRTTFYVTRKGDTIPRVASLFHLDALVLAQVNQVGTAGEMIPGTRLIIPLK